MPFICKARTLGVLALALISPFAIPVASDAAEVTRQLTPNGQVYWHYPVAGAKRTAVAINWPSGLATLPEGQEMAARIGIDVMLNGGGGGKAPDEIIAEFEDLDAGSRLFVQPDQIRGFIVTPDQHMAKAAQIANSVLATPNLNEKWFKRERKNLADSSRGRDTVVQGIAWNLSREIMMVGHPYGRFWSIRPVENIEKVELEAIRKWHASAFNTKNIVVTAAGSTDHQAISAAIDSALVGLPGETGSATHPFPKPKIAGKTVVFHAPKAAKSFIIAFGHLPQQKAGKELPLQISLGVLGYGGQSRLFKAVRTGLRAAYGFGAGYIDYTRQHRLMQIGGEVDTKLLQEALDTTRETYDEFRTSGIGFIEFPIARRFYRQRIDESMRKPEDAAYLLMESRLNGMPKDDLATLPTRIDNLDRAKVNAFIKEAFPPFSELLRIVVTPDADAVEGDCVITAYDQWQECF